MLSVHELQRRHRDTRWTRLLWQLVAEIFMRKGGTKMKPPEEIYAEYLRWCIDNKLPPLNPLQYEKVVAGISSVPDSSKDTPRKKDK
jgi:hypothetical protein